MNNLEKITMEYALNSNNKHSGSKSGGNLKYLLFVGTLNKVVADVKNIEIKDNQLLFNSDFINNSTLQDIRKTLDEEISKNINNFNFIVSDEEKVNWDFVDKRVLEANTDDIFNGKDFDFSTLDYQNRFALCMRVCADLAKYVDNDLEKAKTMYNAISTFLLRFDPPTVLYSVRSQLGLERIVSKNIDEDANFSKIFDLLTMV